MSDITVESSHAMQEDIVLTLDDLLRGGCFFVGLLRPDGTEVSGLGYARKRIESADADISFPLPVTWGQASEYGVWDAPTGGNLIGSAPMEAAYRGGGASSR